MYKSLVFLAAIAVASAAPGQPATPVRRQQEYASTTTFLFQGTSVPSGLTVATNTIGTYDSSTGSVPRANSADNVQVQDGYLVLTVPGGQSSSQPISVAELYTDFDVQFGSVRVNAILSVEPGVCNGLFLYGSDTNEIDVEYLSDPNNPNNDGTAQIHYTNHGPNDSTTVAMSVPDDATTNVHEYRIDWSSESTQFYIDGELQATETTNVPQGPAAWHVNNWANHGPWTKGPPANDAVLQIQSVIIAYNPSD